MRRRTRLVGTILVLAGLLGAVGLVLGTGAGRPDRAMPDLPAAPADHVVVVGVAGLRWSDVTAAGMPTVAGLTRAGSVGTLSVRSAAAVTCPADGWLTLGAGTYATAGYPEGARGCAPRPPLVAGAGPAVPAMPQLRDLNDGPRIGAYPGLLGEHLPCSTAIGPGAALAAADPAGAVDHYLPALPEDVATVLARCPFTAVDLGSVQGDRAGRQRALRALDQAVARVRDSLPPRSVLIVLGVAESEPVQPRLHLVVAQGPGFGPGWLWSPSTRRLPYVQLVDVAPTALAVLGQDVPDEVAGRPLAGGAPGRPDALASIVAGLVETDTQAVAQRAVLGRFFGYFGAALLLLLCSVVWLLRRGRAGPARPGLARWLSIVALAISAVPAASFVANLVPWWRSSTPALAVAAAVTVGALAMVALAILPARRPPPARWPRRWPTGVAALLGALGAITIGVFVIDAFTGARLQLNSLLGYNPLVAGRFVGFGNIAFAVYAAGAVLLAAFVSYGQRPAVVWARLAAVAVPVIVVDGMPWWGADFGGVLTLVPTFVVLGLLLARARVTWWRVAVAAASGVALVLLISWLDYLRPAADRSHFGRFIASMMDGTATTMVRRKLLTNLELLTMGPHTILGAVLVIIGVVLVFRPPTALRRAYRAWPAVRPALIAVVALAGFGFATNDSGIAIPVVAALMVLPAVLALCIWAPAGDADDIPADQDIPADPGDAGDPGGTASPLVRYVPAASPRSFGGATSSAS
jgi:hypothetical protein